MKQRYEKNLVFSLQHTLTLLQHPVTHVAAWCLIIFIETFSLLGLYVPEMSRLWTTLFYYAYTIGLFYLNVCLLFPRVTRRQDGMYRRLVALVVSEVLLIALFLIAVSICFHSLHVQWKGMRNLVFDILNIAYILGPLFYHLFIAAFYFLLLHFVHRYSESLLLNNALLKSQIAPHTFINTLTAIRSCVTDLKGRETISDAVDYLRYALKNNEKGLVLLTDEWTSCQNLLRIYERRYDREFYLDMQLHGDVEGVTCIPYLLVPLLENILKYADLEDPLHVAVFNVKVQDKTLNVETQNRMLDAKGTNSTNVGLNNLSGRLTAFYPGKHRFWYVERDRNYHTYISINLD